MIMFLTHSDDEDCFISAICGDGQHAWPYVTLRLPHSWFVVVYQDQEDGIKYRQTVLLDTFIQLLKINEIKTITEVHLVSPKYMNGQGRWMMSPLIEILEGIEPKTDGQKAHVYVVKNGKRYVESFMETLEENMLHIKTIFKAN
jgi:hypothetical protein